MQSPLFRRSSIAAFAAVVCALAFPARSLGESVLPGPNIVAGALLRPPAESSGTRERTAQDILYSFEGTPDGTAPFGGVVANRDGSLFGTTVIGGAYNLGTIFRLDPVAGGYSEKILYNFKGFHSGDGSNPFASLTLSASGELFGTTESGGSSRKCYEGCGTVFRLKPAGGGYGYRVIYSFDGGAKDGSVPSWALTIRPGGVLYGTTNSGGFSYLCSSGCGTVFKLTPSGAHYVETILYRFAGSTDGWIPSSPLIFENNALLGTTSLGGSGGCGNGVGCGTVFELKPTASGFEKSTLYSFLGVAGNDGANPSGALVIDQSGLMYGTTQMGGVGQSGGSGTVYSMSLSATNSEAVVHIFESDADGARPYGGLLIDSASNLFGATPYGGGKAPWGVVFEIEPNRSNYLYRILHKFQNTPGDGAMPEGTLISDGSGGVFGTTNTGGQQLHLGTVFKVTDQRAHGVSQ